MASQIFLNFYNLQQPLGNSKGILKSPVSSSRWLSGNPEDSQSLVDNSENSCLLYTYKSFQILDRHLSQNLLNSRRISRIFLECQASENFQLNSRDSRRILFSPEFPRAPRSILNITVIISHLDFTETLQNNLCPRLCQNFLEAPIIPWIILNSPGTLICQIFQIISDIPRASYILMEQAKVLSSFVGTFTNSYKLLETHGTICSLLNTRR